MQKTKLLIASSNPGKLREFQEIFQVAFTTQSNPFELLLPTQVGIALDVAETGSSYAENAALKAVAYYQASGLITLADDSGLEVDVLGGQPGLYSARYAPQPHATDADRRAYLLQNLQGKPRPWTAHFHCSLVVVLPGAEQFLTEGDVFGEIIDAERGQGGFGYDPVFYLPDSQRTMAEIPAIEKNSISHRALAVIAALPRLVAIVNGK